MLPPPCDPSSKTKLLVCSHIYVSLSSQKDSSSKDSLTLLPSSKPALAIWQANTVNESHKARGREKWNVRPVKGRMLNCWECPVPPGRARRPSGLRSKQCGGGNTGLQVSPACAACEVQFWRASSVGKTWQQALLLWSCLPVVRLDDLAQSHWLTNGWAPLNSLTLVL